MLSFVQSVNVAVQESMNGSKVMLVYLENQNIGGSSPSWCSSLIESSVKNISQNENLVSVKVVNPSQDYDFFIQVFENVITPSIYLIKTGKVLDIISSEISKDEFEQRISASTKSASPAVLSSNNDGNNDFGADETSTSQSNSNDISSPEPAAFKTKHSNSSKKKGSKPITKKPHSEVKKYNSIKEQIAEDSAEKYKEEQKRLTREKREEKEHIMKLLRQDRLERISPTSNYKSESQKSEKHASTSRDHEKCSLLIRLFDGSKITNEFNASDTLLKVRDWIDVTRDDGDQPYTFYEAVTRKSYSLHQEGMTLAKLNLVPRSALILKPEENYSSAYGSGPSYTQRGWFGKISSTFYGLLGCQHNELHTEESNSLPNDIENDVNSSNEDTNSFYSSTSNVTNSVVSLSDLNKDKDSKLTYNGNHTNLERDPKLKKD